MNESEFKLGKLVLIEIYKGTKTKRKKGKYHCFCGNEFVAYIQAIQRKTTQSCGCYKKFIMKNRMTTHNASNTRLYRIWNNIQTRCFNSNHIQYKDYGGRGITLCKSWLKFENFYNWALSNGYEEHLTIDRENNDKGYYPSNCRIVNILIQTSNTRTKANKTGYPGISKILNGFSSTIRINNKSVYLGFFKTPQEASTAYQQAKKKRDKMYLEEFKQLKTNKNAS